jgi:hypothetical protein
MDCQVTRNSLSLLLDGGLTDNELRTVEDHLDACPACYRIRLELSEIRTAARELPIHTPPPVLWKRVRAEVEAEIDSIRPAPPPLRSRSWRERRFAFTLPQLAGAGVLAGALLLTAAFGLWRGSAFAPGGSEEFTSVGMQMAMIPDEEALKQRAEQLLSRLKPRQKEWDPQMREGFEMHLQRIDDSLGRCRQSLLLRPQDQDHQQLIRALYQEKLRLLEDVERLK